MLPQVGVGEGVRGVLLHAECLRRVRRETCVSGDNAVPMRYVSFSDASGKPRPGVIDGDSIRPFGPEVASLDAFVRMSPADRKAAVAKLGAAIPRQGREAVRAAAPAEERLLRRSQLPRPRRRRREGARPRAEAPRRPDVLHQSTDLDRRSRGSARTFERRLPDVRLGSGAGRDHRDDLPRRLAGRRALESLRLQLPQRRHRARSATFARCSGSRANRSITPARSVRGSSTQKTSAIRRSSRSCCASTASKSSTRTRRR